MRYPVTLRKDDNGTYLVTFPDVPGATTFGETIGETVDRAVDAFLTVVDALIKGRKPIPAPSKGHRRSVFVTIPALEAAKIELYRAMYDAKIGKAELGRRLKWHGPQVDRLINVRHGSQLDQLEAAFGALGKRLELTVMDAKSNRDRRSGVVDRRAPRSRAKQAHAAAR